MLLRNSGKNMAARHSLISGKDISHFQFVIMYARYYHIQTPLPLPVRTMQTNPFSFVITI